MDTKTISMVSSAASLALTAGTSAVSQANEVLTGLGCDPQLIRRSLTVTVGYDFVGYLLTLGETAKARAFDSANMNENIISAGLRLNESEPLLRIEPLYDTGMHNMSFQEQLIGRRDMRRPCDGSIFWRGR